MQLIHARNAEEALIKCIWQVNKLRQFQEPQPSRVGPIWTLGPTTTTYHRPWERVVFAPWRDANPFFHYIEGLWMLGGRNDVRTMAALVKRMGSFSDDGKTFHGAYGYRWRHHFCRDQVEGVIRRLNAGWHDRRAFIAIYDGYKDNQEDCKDIPCNVGIKFYYNPATLALDMVVFNRSNDAILGAYGANAVHMSMLHEYVALSTGLPQGVYSQVSGDLHVYCDNFLDIEKKYAIDCGAGWLSSYAGPAPGPRALFMHKGRFDQELDTMLNTFRECDLSTLQTINLEGIREPAIRDAYRMWCVYHLRKIEGVDQKTLLPLLADIECPDWRRACLEWMGRRGVM